MIHVRSYQSAVCSRVTDDPAQRSPQRGDCPLRLSLRCSHLRSRRAPAYVLTHCPPPQQDTMILD